MWSTQLPEPEVGYRARVDGWDTVIVLVGVGCWWWNAWSEHAGIELSGTAGTLGEAGIAVRRAMIAVDAPGGEPGGPAELRRHMGLVAIGWA